MRVTMKECHDGASLMLEGMSIRSVQRLTGLCRQTLADLVLLVGENCERFLAATVKNVEVNDVQLDEIWSFVGMKEKTRVVRGKSPVTLAIVDLAGIERDTKLILAHQIGQRDAIRAGRFYLKMKNAVGTGRFQITTDGLAPTATTSPSLSSRKWTSPN